VSPNGGTLEKLDNRKHEYSFDKYFGELEKQFGGRNEISITNSEIKFDSRQIKPRKSWFIKAARRKFLTYIHTRENSLTQPSSDKWLSVINSVGNSESDTKDQIFK
jgi:hypothetical protein